MIKSLYKKSTTLLTVSILLASLVGQNVSYASGSVVSPLSTVPHPELLNAYLQDALSKSAMEGSLGMDSLEQPIISSDIDTSSTHKINVIIQLSAQPAAVGIYAAKQGNFTMAAEITQQKVQAQQADFLSAASDADIPLTVNFKYDTVLNGMEVTVNANQIPQLAKIAGVTSIHQNSVYHPITDLESSASVTDATNSYGNDMNPLKQLGVDQAWEMGYTGAGLKVGVIDTGVDYLHPDLKTTFYHDPNGSVTDTVYGYDSFNQDSDPYEDYPKGLYPGSSHGTHVAGTIVGRALNDTADFVQKGIAYEAELHVYKVMGVKSDDYDSTAPTGSSAQIINGIEHAVEDDMDVINLSLGSSTTKDDNSPESIAINNAVLSGVVAVVANGNDGSSGHYYYSMGSPASAQLAISVAAATSPSMQYAATIRSSIVATADQPIKIVAWEMGHVNFNDILGTNPIDQTNALDAVFVSLGRETDYEGFENNRIDGKIAFVSRGEIPIEEKVKNAKNHGAIAVILFNGKNKIVDDMSVPDLSESIPGRDDVIGSIAALGDSANYIPVLDMAGTTGRAIARELVNNPDAPPLKFTFGSTFDEIRLQGDTIADFSSRGPNSDDNYGIKPDISAPGVNIYSTFPAFGQMNPGADYSHAYARESGTSMAAPHIAGLSLLLLDKHKNDKDANGNPLEFTPADVRAALANTADEIRTAADGTLYDVYSQGSGRANIVNALQTPALLQALNKITIYDDHMNPITMDSEASNLSFGMIDPGSEVSEPLQLKNISGDTLTYKASVVMHNQVTSDPNHPIPTPDVSKITMKLDGNIADSSTTMTVSPYEKHVFTLSATAAEDAPQGVYEGEIVLTSDNEKQPDLHLPFVIHVGDDSPNNGFEIQKVTLSDRTAYPDAPVDITATLKSNKMNFMMVNIYGLDQVPLGTLSVIANIDEYSHEYLPIPAGKTLLSSFDGGYTEGKLIETGENVVHSLPTGMYILGILAVNYNSVTGQYEDYETVFKTIYVKN